MKNNYLTIHFAIILLSVFIICIANINIAQATKGMCAWTLGECKQIGTYWYNSNNKECLQPKPNKGKTEKCCCPVGCCRYVVNGVARSTTAMNSDECQVKIKAISGAVFNGYHINQYPNGQNGCSFMEVVNIDSTGSVTINNLSSTLPKDSNSSTLPKDSLGSSSSDSLGSMSNQDSLSSSNNSRSLESYPNPLNTIDIRVIIGKVVRAILIIVGALALMMFVYGGFTWLTSAGNEQKVETGRNTLIWSSLGLIIVFSAYILVKYVMEAVGAI